MYRKENEDFMNFNVKYSMGLVFDENKNYVMLLHKTKPDFLVGKWNAPGGKIEENESALDCCVREVYEETDVMIDSVKWTHIFHIENIPNSYSLDVFSAISDSIFSAKTTTEEKVHIINLTNLDMYHLGPNINWFIEFARERSNSFVLPIHIDDFGGD